MKQSFNIRYDRGDGTFSHYLQCWVDKATAEIYLAKFVEQYVGKPYPNGKGFYPFTNPRIVERCQA